MNRHRARGAHGAHEEENATRGDAVWLAAALREQGDEHEADVQRIKARFDQLTGAEPRRVSRRRPVGALRLRLLGVPLGFVAAAATATIAVGVTLGISAHTTQPTSQAATSPSQSSSASDRQSVAPGVSATPTQVHPAGTASTRDESSPSPSLSPSPGPVTAAGTVDSHSTQYWAQEDLSVTTTRVIRTLQVTVNVSGGATVQSTGSWSGIPAAYVNIAVSRTSGGLTYDFALKPGVTLPAGTYAFGIQFNRPAAGHNFAGDAFTVTADATGDAKQASAVGVFVG